MPITSLLYDRLVNVRIREIDGPLYATAEHMHVRARAHVNVPSHELSVWFALFRILMRPHVESIFLVTNIEKKLNIKFKK